MGELISAAMVGCGFLLIFGAAELWHRLGDPPVELSRKFVHVASGLLVLAFPWIFTSRWTVLGLAAGFALLILGTRRVGMLQSIHGVSRRSEGGLFYPLAVVLLFTLAYDERVFYLISVLALIVSDPAAALLGKVYGKTAYWVEEDRRSIEGSVSFFVTTFLIVHLPLLLMTELDRDVCVLLALHISLVVTLIEGVSLRGSDNLLIPLSAFYLLVRFTPESASVMGRHISVLLVTFALLTVFCLRSRLMRTSGVMAAALFFYGVYLFGNAQWMAAPTLALGGIAGLRRVLRIRGSVPDGHYEVLAAIYAGVVALTLIVAHDVLPRALSGPAWLLEGDAFRAPFVGVIAGQAAVIAATQFRPFGPQNREPPSIPLTLTVLAGSLVVVVPAGLWLTGGVTIVSATTAVAITAIAVAFYWTARKLPGWPGEPPWNMRLQAASLAAATVLMLPIHFLLLAGN